MPPPGSSQLANSLKRVASQSDFQSLFQSQFKMDPSRQFNFLLFGAPGVGKGTFAKLIQKDFQFMPFSTGDYFRSVIKKASEGSAGQKLDDFTFKINEILKSGELVDDQVVVDIVKNLKENPETFMDGTFSNTKGLILDGMPRTLKQAQMLNEFTQIDLVLNFFNKEEVLI